MRLSITLCAGSRGGCAVSYNGAGVDRWLGWLCLLTLQPTGSWAANFTAGTATQLINAITTANANGQADTITLTADITLTTVDNNTYGNTGLPVISSEIIIEGNRKTIGRDGGAPDFRMVAVTSGGDLTLRDTTISGGVANGLFPPDNLGGGIYNRAGTVTLERSTVSGNTCTGGGGAVGGGMYSSAQNGGASAVVTLTDSTVSDNTARAAAGIVNFARSGGSAVLTLTNSTVSGNRATNGFGGGVFNTAFYSGIASATLSNSTVSGNSPSNTAGGLVNAGFQGTSTMTLTRSLISGNTAGNSADEVRLYYGTIVADNHNLFGHSGHTSARAFIDFSPGATDINATSDGTLPTALGAILDTTLRHNGGFTYNHAPVLGSPAIDASPADGDCEATDQRGISRPQGSDCEIGAVEYVPGTPDISAICGDGLPTTGCTVNGKKNQLCIGTSGNDTIVGTKGDDVILGLGGNDTIKGGEGDDCIDGGLGNDRVEGQDGEDVLIGGGGNDQVRGGTGTDLILTSRGDDRVQGDEGNDFIFDNGGKNSLLGRLGDDFIFANATGFCGHKRKPPIEEATKRLCSQLA